MLLLLLPQQAEVPAVVAVVTLGKLPNSMAFRWFKATITMEPFKVVWEALMWEVATTICRFNPATQVECNNQTLETTTVEHSFSVVAITVVQVTQRLRRHPLLALLLALLLVAVAAILLAVAVAVHPLVAVAVALPLTAVAVNHLL
jgi:hypothetical protein